MEALLALIGWKWIAVVFTALVAIVSAWFHGKSSGQDAAAKDVAAANTERDTAKVEAASATAAVQAVQASAADKQQIDSDVAKVAATPGALDKALTDEGYTE